MINNLLLALAPLPRRRRRLFLEFVLLFAVVTKTQADLCVPDGNTLHVQVDLFSSALGQYTFRECGDKNINPTLGLRRGQTYTFLQADRTNYYHPLGITGTANIFKSGDDRVMDREIYERRFFEPASLWSGYEDMSVTITIDANTELTTTTYLYYCLIHHSMEGKIQIIDEEPSKTLQSVVSGSSRTTATQSNALGIDFIDDRSEFDKRCGTYGLGQFQLPNPLCPDRFVCGTDAVTDELQLFSSCLEAANCAMISGMTTGVQATDDSALFIHQMIPHHENAVNTAKTLLKTGNLLCPDLTDQSNPDCILESILYGIIAGQNYQIQLMRQFLSDYRYPQSDNCDVFVETINKEQRVATKASSSATRRLLLEVVLVVAIGLMV